MKDNYDSWRASSHRSVTCNGCHVPHDIFGKYLAKADNGIRHSWAFTFLNVERLRIIPRNLDRLQANCVRCHAATVGLLLVSSPDSGLRCSRCHRGSGHAF